jgi:enamine deaminase RidA (YjgF/YER057c/UK114 family)
MLDVVERFHDGSAFEAMASYSRATRSGPFVVVSATAALGESGQPLYPGDTYGQTKLALQRALAAAEQLGAVPNDTLRTRVYFTPSADWRDGIRAHQEVFEGVDPANTTLFVVGFPVDGALVEVEVEAWVDSQR